jgi:hypothetical protein
MSTTKKKAVTEQTATETTRRRRVLGWAELGLENAAAAQKQWNDITFAYTDLALKGWKDTLGWIETYNEQARKTVTSLNHARQERAKAILDRLS